MYDPENHDIRNRKKVAKSCGFCFRDGWLDCRIRVNLAKKRITLSSKTLPRAIEINPVKEMQAGLSVFAISQAS